MNYKVLIFLFFGSSAVMAQGLELMKDQVGRPILSTKNVIDGNPYLSKNWVNGIVYLKDNRKFLSYSNLNFNILENRIEFENSNKVFFVEPSLFNEVDFYLDGDTVKFKKGFNQTDLNTDKFYQILLVGKNIWLKQHIKNVVNDSGASYASQASKVIQDDFKIYMLHDNATTLIKMNKRYLKNIFKGNAGAISLIENADMSFESKGSEISFLKALDSQL